MPKSQSASQTKPQPTVSKEKQKSQKTKPQPTVSKEKQKKSQQTKPQTKPPSDQQIYKSCTKTNTVVPCTLGKGGFGIVYLSKDKTTNKLIATKKILKKHLNSNNTQMLKRSFKEEYHNLLQLKKKIYVIDLFV